jgi:uncharacterized protein YggL (DUF469 family)
VKKRFNDPKHLTRYNRRQRKKHRIGEFQECIFSVKASFNPPLTRERYDVFIDEFFDLADERMLSIWAFGGSFPLQETNGVVEASYKSPNLSPTEQDREVVLTWFNHHPMVESVSVGELVDGWYGYDEEDDNNEPKSAKKPDPRHYYRKVRSRR